MEEKPLARKCLMVAGSDQRCEWRINHVDIAPRHLCIAEENGRFQATALNKGVYLGQYSMIVGKNYWLDDGQVITIGNLRIQCHLQADFESCNTPRRSQCQQEKWIFQASQVDSKVPDWRWSLEKRQTSLFGLCLLLPLASFSLLTQPWLIQSGSSSQPPIHRASPEAFAGHSHTHTQAVGLIVAKLQNQPTSQPYLRAEMAVVESEQLQNPQHEVAALITPSHFGNPGEQKPYGLASPLHRARYYTATISAAAQRYELDPALVKAVIHAESGFDPFAISNAGAQGLMQIMPATAKTLALSDPFHPGNNVLSGSKLLRRLLDKYQQDETLALAAYNAGENAVEKYQGVPPYTETQKYIQKVRKLRTQYRIAKAKQMAAAQ